MSTMSAAQIQPQLNANYYLNAFSFTLLFYDYFITLEWEVSRYWGSTLTSPTILFFANRYGTLLGNIPAVVMNFWTAPATSRKTQVSSGVDSVGESDGRSDTPQICGTLDSYHQYFIIIIQIIVGVMLLLRTYALYERSKRILIFMILSSAGIIAIGVWATIFSNHASDPGQPQALYIGCTYTVTHAESKGLIIAWSAMGLFDCMIFLLTLYKSLSRHMRHLSGFSLLVVLLRDGSIYFGVMVGSNLANILTFVLGGLYTRGLANTFTNIISSIMISRLMLNLRDPTLAAGASSRGSATTRARDGEWTSDDAGVFSTILDADSIPLERTNRMQADAPVAS